MDFLNSHVNQSEFANIVGVSRQAIQKQSKKIGLDKALTLGEWLVLYCEHLRQEAAGRGGDAAVGLSEQRAEESRQNTLAKMLDNMEKMGLLCPTEDVIEAFNGLSHTIPTAIDNAGEKIVEKITSQHKIEFDDELVFEPLRSAIESIADDAKKLGGSFEQRLVESQAQATYFDS
ncbi:hypothetical protein [Agarilytica rhodophyticola]|uniref:hypothetical protein n=1 Tax=Agarilytica rhodophyticola TaxID=1737490 RepID=UPI001319C3BD|nr:hypothetical protein [Agarilytica rhodophyticola]